MGNLPIGARGRVLVIDDDAQVRRTVSRLLSREHDVDTAESPTEALRAIVAGATYDVVFCDLSMPNMSGIECARSITSIAPEYGDRIVYLTGADPSACEAMGAMVVTKPFMAEDLRAVVRRFVLARVAA